MNADTELLSIADAILKLQDRFVPSSSSGLFLQSEDQAEFKRLAVEAKAMLDEALGANNDFSVNFVRAINAGSGGFFGGPSYAAVCEAAGLLQGAVNHLRRRQPAAQTTLKPAALRPPYVDPARLAEILSIKGQAWDLTRLGQLCGELNIAHENDCHMSVAMLVRAIVDHVPPIFGSRTFTEVANNHAARSLKVLMLKLDQSLRPIADAHLHVQVRRQESVPTATQVDFRQELDALLQEVVRLAR